MAQTWPASVTTEPGVAGGAAAALLLVSYASELKALRWLPQFFFFLLLYFFFKNKLSIKLFCWFMNLLIKCFVCRFLVLNFCFFNSGSNFFLSDFFFVSKIFILIFFLSFLTNVYTKFCISTKYIHAKLFCLNKFA